MKYHKADWMSERQRASRTWPLRKLSSTMSVCAAGRPRWWIDIPTFSRSVSVQLRESSIAWGLRYIHIIHTACQATHPNIFFGRLHLQKLDVNALKSFILERKWKLWWYNFGSKLNRQKGSLLVPRLWKSSLAVSAFGWDLTQKPAYTKESASSAPTNYPIYTRIVPTKNLGLILLKEEIVAFEWNARCLREQLSRLEKREEERNI